MNPGLPFSAALGLLFIGLKLGNVIDWSWTWVLAPLWIPFLIGLVVILTMLICAWIEEVSWQKRRR